MSGRDSVQHLHSSPTRRLRTLPLASSTLLLLVGGSPAFAYVLNGNRWPGSHPRVPFYISTSLEGNIPYDGSAPFSEVVEHIQNAASEWNNWQSAYQHGGSNFEFYYAGTTPVSTLADDGINTILWSDGECPTFIGCTAITTGHISNGVFRGFDIVLYKYRNDGARVFWKTQMTFPTQRDLWSLMLHELGHVVGLDHAQSSGVVMGTGCGNGCTRRYLANDDIDGILALYGPYTNEGFWSDVSTVEPGQTFGLHLDYPLAPGRNFGLFFNATGPGSTPMVPPDWRVLPLASPYENARNYSSVFLNPTCLVGGQCQNMFGTLDVNGQATVTVQLPADALTSLGPDLYLAAVTRNTAMPSDYEDISVGVHVQLQAPPPCPNGTCDPGETPCNCPQDCGAPAASEAPGSTCADDLDNDCDGYPDCADVDCVTDAVACPIGQVPTVSEWGFLVMTLLTLVSGTILIRRMS